MKHVCFHLSPLYIRKLVLLTKTPRTFPFQNVIHHNSFLNLPTILSITPDISATMSSTGYAPTQLQPLLVTLSALHLSADISTLHSLSGIEVSLPKSVTGTPVTFKAIVSESTNTNLLLKSFYDSNIRGKVFNGVEYVLSSLADLGRSCCAFTSTFGMMAGQPPLNDKMTPQFKVDGRSHVPLMHQGYFFSPDFLICDHIFCRQEYEAQFVAVLSLDFLRRYFIRAQYNKKGWMIQLPPHPPTDIRELAVYTDGCCLSNGLAAGNPEAKPAQGGYGIHFPTLPNGWDMYGALASKDGHTNQKAELTAIIRALQLIRLRNVQCEKISIFTDSKYAVQGLNEWIPHIWRSNGYRTAKNHVVVNADLFKSLDMEVSLSIERRIPVTLNHIPREQNKKADALSRLGAKSEVPSINLSNPNKGSSKEAGVEVPESIGKVGKKGVKADGIGRDGRPDFIIGSNFHEIMKPLVQWSPDGVYWVRWQSTDDPSETLKSGMESLVV